MAQSSCCAESSDDRAGAPQVIDVFREHGLTYRERHWVSAEQSNVLRDLSACRTAALGGNRRTCPECGHSEIHYNSCGNRHCPNCRSLCRATWLSARLARFLPVAHFFVTFTLPDQLREIAMQNQRAVYDLMLSAVRVTFETLGLSDLGGTMGVLAALHTWTRELLYHPHVHALVTGGALSGDGRWVATRPSFLFPHRRLAAIFRKLMLQGLCQLYEQGRLRFRGDQEQLNQPWVFKRLIGKLWKIRWVVDVEAPPLGARPQQALKYLARYAHGVAISDRRMVSSRGESVTFKTRDGNCLTLPAEEFLRRFLLHVLPRGFNKLRYYGLYASRAGDDLARARAVLPAGNQPFAVGDEEIPLCELEDWDERVLALTGIDPLVCPNCGCRDLWFTPIERTPPARRSSPRNTS